ncbi:hypothetical protein CBM2633_U10044 [Cupriavidus taiwanensis]|nr:hypothetical protein CBM2633_U10044 [Cupriavidus taiwanensis]
MTSSHAGCLAEALPTPLQRGFLFNLFASLLLGVRSSPPI